MSLHPCTKKSWYTDEGTRIFGKNEKLLEAFKTNGIAYLLKPYSDEELKKALDKYLKLFHSEDKLFFSHRFHAIPIIIHPFQY